MNTENKTTRIDVSAGAISRKAFDPEALWLDQDIEPEELIQIDPLDITDRMVEAAEKPELADPVLRRLPE
jgi:hypothetical protein